MNIQTKYLGTVAIEEKNMIHFPSGIPGFNEEKQFILLDIPGNPVFQFLQSVQTEELAFIVTDPYHFYNDYTIELDDPTLNTLKITSKEEVFVMSIVTLKDPFDNSTINLKAPLIINHKKMLGKQLILNSDTLQSKATIKPVTVQKGV